MHIYTGQLVASWIFCTCIEHLEYIDEDMIVVKVYAFLLLTMWTSGQEVDPSCLARKLALGKSIEECGMNVAVKKYTKKGNIEQWSLGKESNPFLKFN